MDSILNYKDADNPGCGLLNTHGICSRYDIDTDGVPNFLDLDSDNDGIPDLVEALSATYIASDALIASIDSNRDGMVDGPYGINGLAQAIETFPASGIVNASIMAVPDTDGDGVSDFMDLDSDGDGILDLLESRGWSWSALVGLDTNQDGVIDVVPDGDQDGIPDLLDLSASVYGSVGCTIKLTNADTSAIGSAIDRDGDGICDFRDLDSDNDGMTDLYECNLAGLLNADLDHNGVVDIAGSIDADHDGIRSSIDNNDSVFGSAMLYNLLDTDTDGHADHADLDADNDGVSDLFESGNPNAITADVLGNGTVHGSDSDGDGIRDAVDNAVLVFGSPSSRPPNVHSASGIPDYRTPFSFDMRRPSDLQRSGRSPTQYDADNNGVLDSNSDTDYDGICDLTTVGSYVIDINIGDFGGLPPPALVYTAVLDNRIAPPNIFVPSNQVKLFFTTTTEVPIEFQASDFAVTDAGGQGRVQSVTRIGTSTPASYLVLVDLPCDGTMLVRFLDNVTMGSASVVVRVINAKCVVRSITPVAS
jgi:hypothetical protein